MSDPGHQQLEIQLGVSPLKNGFNQWQEQRHAAMQKLARQWGLPLEHRVEIWLRDGIRLRGVLRLGEMKLFVDTRVGPIAMDSCAKPLLWSDNDSSSAIPWPPTSASIG